MIKTSGRNGVPVLRIWGREKRKSASLKIVNKRFMYVLLQSVVFLYFCLYNNGNYCLRQMFSHTHTHTHTHIYIYIYIISERIGGRSYLIARSSYQESRWIFLFIYWHINLHRLFNAPAILLEAMILIKPTTGRIGGAYLSQGY